MIGIYLYRISNFLYKKHVPIIPKIFPVITYVICNGWIPYNVEIGDNTYFGYGGMGLVINKNAKIGKNCLISHQVTIGANDGVPIIGNNVYIGSGTKIFGGIKIGNNVIIGANSVVLKDIPDNCLVGGVPAKIIRENIDIMVYIKRLWSYKFNQKIKNGKIKL